MLSVSPTRRLHTYAHNLPPPDIALTSSYLVVLSDISVALSRAPIDELSMTLGHSVPPVPGVLVPVRPVERVRR